MTDYTSSHPQNASLSQRDLVLALQVETVDRGLLRRRQKTLRMPLWLKNGDVSANSDCNSDQMAQKSLSEKKLTIQPNV